MKTPSPRGRGSLTTDIARDASASLVLSRDAVRRVDAAAIEEFHIPGIVLMENAARGLADAAMQMLRARTEGQVPEDDSAPVARAQRPHPLPLSHPPIEERGTRALIVCGSGNNGGDGFALARHLSNSEVSVTIARLGEPRDGTDAMTNLRICRAMRIDEFEIGSSEALGGRGGVDLIVDAVFGTGLDRAVTGLAAQVIAWINEAGRPVLAVDVPSGLDCDTGFPLGVAVKATRTVTFVAMKPGFLREESRTWTGEVTVAGIGAPVELIERLGTRIEGA